MRTITLTIFLSVFLLGNVTLANSTIFPLDLDRVGSKAKNTGIYSFYFRVDVIEYDGIPLDAVTVIGRNEYGSLAPFNNGGQLLLTSSNVYVNVTNGIIAMDFNANDGTTITLVASAGNSIEFEPDSFTITPSITNAKAVFVLIEGIEFVILPGESTRFVQIGIIHTNDGALFNQNTKGLIPIVIYGSAYLDVSSIDMDSLLIEGLVVEGERKANIAATMDHINADAYPDLVVRFEANNNFLNGDFSYAILRGQLSDGIIIKGITGLHLNY